MVSLPRKPGRSDKENTLKNANSMMKTEKTAIAQLEPDMAIKDLFDKWIQILMRIFRVV
jgi:hypothetical protein